MPRKRKKEATPAKTADSVASGKKRKMQGDESPDDSSLEEISVPETLSDSPRATLESTSLASPNYSSKNSDSKAEALDTTPLPVYTSQSCSPSPIAYSPHFFASSSPKQMKEILPKKRRWHLRH